jgi:Pyridoxal-dependent decarboxylase conserved domain
MDDVGELLHRAADEATAYLSGFANRPVGESAGPAALAGLLPVELPAESLSAEEVLSEVLAVAADGIVATGSPRYFGFVIGGALPAAIAADWMATVWDQNAGLYAGGPAAAVLEATAGRWILDALDLPRTSSFALVTGCQMAHVTCLAAARHHVLADRGWDVERGGLSGAPRLRVIVGELSHVTVARALRLLGVGSAAIEVVPVDHTSRMRTDALDAMLDGDEGPTIVCAQLGEVNTGAWTRSARSSMSLTRAARGFTLMGPSACGRARAPATAISPTGSIGRTHGPPTLTSGSTSPMTAASQSAPTPRTTTAPWPSTPTTWASP